MKTGQLNTFLRGNWVVLVLLGLTAFLAYINSIDNEFVSDDIAAIVTNRTAGDVWGNLKRDLTLTGFEKSLVYTVAGAKPPLHHLNNIIWHVGVVVMVYVLVLAVSGDRKLSWVSGFLFALHPIHTEAVTWISGFPYLISTFFVFLTLIVYVLVDKGRLSGKWLWVSLFLSLLSYYSIEKAVALPGFIFLYEFLNKGFKRAVVRTTLFAAPLAFYLFNNFTRISGVVNERTFQEGAPSFSPFLSVPVAIATYLQLLVAPVNLTLYHEAFIISTEAFIFDASLFVLALLATGFLWYKKQKTLTFFAGIFWLGLVPTLLPFKLSWLVAERYAYLPSLGFVVVLAWILIQLEKKKKDVFWICLILILALYAFLTIRRNFEWQSQDTLWPVTVLASPYSSLARNNMGDYFARHGDFKRAKEEFTAAVTIRPTFADAIHNLANVYMQEGDATTAAKLFARALEISPGLKPSIINLAVVYMTMGNYNAAKEVLMKGLSMYPDSTEVYNALAVYYVYVGDKKQARAALEKVLSLDPGNVTARKNLLIVDK